MTTAAALLFALALACGDKDGGDDPDRTPDGGASDGGSSDGGADGGSGDGGSGDGGSGDGGADGGADGGSGDGGADGGSGDGGSDGGTGIDNDEDGWEEGVDCDDTDPDIHPDADELCDGIDNDCDGEVDDHPVEGSVWYEDVDEDGFGDADSAGILFCSPPDDGNSWSYRGTDCDDDDPLVNPDADEVCDELDVDEDCSGAADDDDPGVDNSTTTRWYPDADGDGYAPAGASGIRRCNDPSTDGAAYSTERTDCDDTDPLVSPAGVEVCDELDVDEDCDGQSDDADDSVDLATATTWYADADDDGYGDAAGEGAPFCDDPSTTDDAWSADNSDCDDGNDRINPGRAEVCDSRDIDEDCDGLADDDDDDTDMGRASTWFVDADRDGYGSDDDPGSLLCNDPGTASLDYVTQSGDCDDGDAAINPDAQDLYGDGIDQDCDDLDRPAVECDGYDVPGDYDSIEDAVAALRDGAEVSTVCLGAGSWEGFTLSGNITLVGAGVDDTIVTGDVLLQAHGDGSWQTGLRHMTLQEGVEVNDHDAETAAYTLADLRIQTEAAPDAEAAVVLHRAQAADLDLVIERVELAGDPTAAAIYLLDEGRVEDGGPRADVTVRNSWIHDADVGIQALSSSAGSDYRPALRVEVHGCTIVDNGHGLWLEDGDGVGQFEVVDNIVQGNTVGLYLDTTATVALNAWYDNDTDFQDLADDSTGLFEDPLLDWSFQPPTPDPDSPAVGAGDGAYGDRLDFWSRDRPLRSTMGAVEAWD